MVFDLIWYLLSPFTLITFPLSSGNDDYDDNDNKTYTNNNTYNDTNNNGPNKINEPHANKPRIRSVNIPYYIQGENEDSTVLQIKSLVYIFNRFRISSLKPFLKFNEVTDECDFDYYDTTSNPHSGTSSRNNKGPSRANTYLNSRGILMNEKLDSVYNINHFKSQLLNDPYRILVDYNKNKFRSFLILSDAPQDFNDIPNFNTPSFSFLILKPNDPVEKYIEILVNKSGIYSEHRIHNKIKVQILMKIISRQKKLHDQLNPTLTPTPNNDFKQIDFNKDDRANIIRSYVQKLAFYIQVQRIYKAALKSKEREMKKLYKYSNDKSIQSYKSLKSERSRMILLPESSSSPKKYDTSNIRNTSDSNTASNPISIMELEDNNNPNNTDYPYYSDTGESQASSTSSINFTKLFTSEEKHICFEQSKMAVRIRIERERSSMMF